MSVILCAQHTERLLHSTKSRRMRAPERGFTMGKTLERQALERLGKDWSKASLTREKLLGNTREFARFVSERYGLERIENLKPKMVQAFVRDMHERDLAPSTMAGKMTAVRELAGAIGKQNIVERQNSSYGIERVRVNPQPVNHDRLGEVRQAISAMADQGNKIALMVRAADSLREEFGLRAKESLLSSKVETKDGKLYLTVEGAKGGRPRELEVRTEGQLRAIQLVAETSAALNSGTGRIIPPSMNLQQAYDAQRNLWRECGGTRENGGNMHAERHAFAREQDEGGASRAEIMANLGHGEDRSPAAYLPK